MRSYDKRASPPERDLATCLPGSRLGGMIFFHMNAPARLTGLDFTVYDAHAPFCFCHSTKMADSEGSTEKFERKTKKHATKQGTGKKCFRWDISQVEHLIDCISDYKSKMMYKGLDFDADKPAMYKHIREAMAEIYEDDISLFGPVNITTYDNTIDDESNADEVMHIRALNKVENEQITKGRNRIVEKVKEIRQSFSRAVTSGTRS